MRKKWAELTRQEAGWVERRRRFQKLFAAKVEQAENGKRAETDARAPESD